MIKPKLKIIRATMNVLI